MDLPTNGAADEALGRQAHRQWLDAAGRAGLDLAGFDPDAPFNSRLAWAAGRGLAVAAVYARYSSRQQHSTADQLRACVAWAAQNGAYAPPELLCADEGAKGRRVRRDGLGRLRVVLKSRLAGVLLVFKVSRLFRQAFRGFQMIQEEVVEAGLRAVSVSQGIDTADARSWKAQLALHGLLDDLLLDAIADHVREGLAGLFLRGYVTGALTLGYKAVEVPGAPPTNRGRPRTMPAVDGPVAELILQHFEMARDGVPLREGLRRWRAAGGPADPRSAAGAMSSQAYRRMLLNPRYTGAWAFGRRRNRWSSRGDYTRQEDAPAAEVKTFRCEELRVVSDELFHAVQQRLRARETGPRAPRAAKERPLWALLTGLFHCATCRRRFHTCGAHGRAMRCPSPDCPAPVMVDRKGAVAAVCKALEGLVVRDEELVALVLEAARRPGAGGGDAAAAAELGRRAAALTARIDDLTELAGQGSAEDRAELKGKVRAAQAERAGLQREAARLAQAAGRPAPAEAEVRAALAELGAVVRAAGGGELGPEAVYRAADVVRRLAGGRVWVRAEPRAGRKRAAVKGRFAPGLLRALAEGCGAPPPEGAGEVEVWLRPPPRLDAAAAEVRRLYEEEGLGFRAIAKRLGVGCGNVYSSYRRLYEMRGEPVPPRRPRGRPRRA